MRTMGLDYGDRTIGVAISDELGFTAQGIEVISRRSEDHDVGRLRELIQEYDVNELVVGLPKNMNGTIGPRGEMSMQFAALLEEQLQLQVHLWDERLTTVAANRALLEADISRKKRRQVVDKLAAVFILQGYIDSKNRR